MSHNKIGEEGYHVALKYLQNSFTERKKNFLA